MWWPAKRLPEVVKNRVDKDVGVASKASGGHMEKEKPPSLG